MFCEEPFTHEVDHSQSLLAFYCRKVCEENVETIACFQVIKKVIYWNTGTGEDGCATHLFRIDFN